VSTHPSPCNHYAFDDNSSVHQRPGGQEENAELSNKSNAVDRWTGKGGQNGSARVFSASTPREDAPQNGNGAAADSQVNDDGLSFPDDLRRCTHCGKNGAVPPSRVVLPDRAVWLHRECEGPWLEGGR
jgi:hypothetical protein